MIELILSLAVVGALFGIASQTLIRQADTFSFIANRKTAIGDVRFALNRMSGELKHLETADIQDISATKINFIGRNGQATSFSLKTNGKNVSIFHGNEVLIPRVENFHLEYQDGQGKSLNPDPGEMPNVRRIKITVKTEPVADEGSITLSTTVVPRGFIGYTNYQ